MSADTIEGLCNRMAARSLGNLADLLAGEDWAVTDSQGTEIDAMTLLAPAARGDLDAQRRLAILGIFHVYDGETADCLIGLAESLSFARLAAAQGDRDDKFRLAMALGLASALSGPGDPHKYGAEAIGLLELLADDGDEPAARMLAAYAGEESEQTLALAREYRSRLAALKEAE